MSIPSRCEGEGSPRDPQSEALLESVREGILLSAIGRLDEAMGLEDAQGRVYVQDAPVDTPTEEVVAIMLTRDGERPFQEEADIKEQLILYFPNDFADLIWIEHIRDGSRDKFTLDKFGLEPYDDPDELLAQEEALDPTEGEADEVVEALPISDMARISLLREKIDRFLLTPQD